MIAAVQAALDHQGVDDTIREVGQFMPRGTTGSMFAGGMIGGDVGGAFGEVGDAIGTAAGALGGLAANAESRGMPTQMLVGASDSVIYGFKMSEGGRRKEPHELVFRVPRSAVDVRVHGRVNVRVLDSQVKVRSQRPTRLQTTKARRRAPPADRARRHVDLELAWP